MDVAGLERMKHKGVYSVQFKLAVFRRTNYSTIANWNKVFLEKGLEVLDKPRDGHPCQIKKKVKLTK